MVTLLSNPTNQIPLAMLRIPAFRYINFHSMKYAGSHLAKEYSTLNKLIVKKTIPLVTLNVQRSSMRKILDTKIG